MRTQKEIAFVLRPRKESRGKIFAKFGWRLAKLSNKIWVTPARNSGPGQTTSPEARGRPKLSCCFLLSCRSPHLTQSTLGLVWFAWLVPEIARQKPASTVSRHVIMLFKSMHALTATATKEISKGTTLACAELFRPEGTRWPQKFREAIPPTQPKPTKSRNHRLS